MLSGNITIDDRQVRAWLKKVENPRSVFTNTLKAVGVKGEGIAKEKGKQMTASGTFVASIDHVLEGYEAVEIRLNNEKYGYIAFESGRPPGKAPPIGALRIWARKRGLAKGVEYAVQKKIKREGTTKWIKKGPKYRTETIKDLEKEIPRILDQLDKFYASN